MKILHHGGPQSSERGAALLLSLIILFLLVAIVIQINIGTSTDARIARNDVGLTAMDLAIESALLQEYDQISSDTGSDASGAGGTTGGGGGAGQAAGGQAAAGAGPAGAGGGQATDSRRDEWAQVQRTEINEIKLRIFVQDEDSKLNVLTLINPDEKEAQAALDRVVRCLDLCREGTRADISERGAQDMARGMLEFMKQRNLARLPRPTLLTDNEQEPDTGLPLSLRDFAILPTFDESLFRDYRDEDGNIVHSIGSFLTVWTSLSTKSDDEQSQGSGAGGAPGAGNTPGGQGNPPPTGNPPPSGNPPPNTGGGNNPPPSSGAPGANGAPGAAGAAGAAGAQAQSSPGWSVNVNTAPVAVLKSLFDDRDVHPRLWDKVVEYRNLEEEDEDEEEEEEEPVYDEFGDEVIERKIFDSLSELSEVDGFNDLGAETQNKVRERLTTQSNVFSIYIVARRTTSAEADPVFAEPESRRLAEEQGDALVRVIRAVVWRKSVDDEVQIVPIVRWEWLDYVPYEVQDYPDERR
jgi:hypothetical protein